VFDHCCLFWSLKGDFVHAAPPPVNNQTATAAEHEQQSRDHAAPSHRSVVDIATWPSFLFVEAPARNWFV